MRKSIVAIATGLLLVAGQAAAAGSNSAVARIGDRVGARSGEAEQLLGIPVAVLIIGSAVLIAAVTVVADDGASD